MGKSKKPKKHHRSRGDEEESERSFSSFSSSSSSSSSSSTSSSSPRKRKRPSGDALGEQAEKNRESVKSRSRMWTTVGSSSEAEEDDSGRRGRGKNDASDSDAGSQDERRRHKKDHKRHKHHRQDKDKKKEKKRKRDKKDKKKKKHKEKDPERGGKVGAVDQAQFGKWGIVRESDFFKKQREFEAWMVEVKKVVDSSQMQKWELRDLFKEYAEDFNTATLPHAKFINYEKWEVEEYQKNQRKLAKARAKGVISISDDVRLEEERRREKARKDEAEFNRQIMQTMRKDKVEEMRKQELLRAEMQLAYKQGDIDKVKRIEARLAPDEMEAWR